MKQILIIGLSLGIVIGIAASAVASSDETAPVKTYTAMPEPRECETVVSTLLQKKKDALDRRERSIKAREADLMDAEQRAREELERLVTVREELKGLMSEMDAEQKKEVNRLVLMFQKMRGKKAAKILETTETDVAVEVLRNMQEKKAGETMSAMSPEKAAELANEISLHPFKKFEQENAAAAETPAEENAAPAETPN